MFDDDEGLSIERITKEQLKTRDGLVDEVNDAFAGCPCDSIKMADERFNGDETKFE